MGINGLWDEVRKKASARQVDLAVLSSECMRQRGRPLRVAVDVSCDIYTYLNATQTAKTAGGMNHPTRTFFYHVLHYMMAGVQPIFVYDGPQRPPVKRDRYVPRQVQSTAPFPPKSASSVRNTDDVEKEFGYEHLVELYRQVLVLLGVPWLEAPGEAEAECATLENAGIVDAVCTKDGDAFAFGGFQVLLPCNKEVRRGRTVLPVQVFDANSSSDGTKVMSKEDFMLLAIMAGGDYDHGIPNCGPDLAMAAAQAGYGEKLVAIANSGNYVPGKLAAWKNQLKMAIRNGKFGNRHRSVADRIPAEFPIRRVLDLYLNPVVSSEEALQLLKKTISWNGPTDVLKLQEFTKAHFDWKGRHFARKFINILCSPLLARALLRHTENGQDATGISTEIKQSRNAVAHVSPDELRLEFTPQDIVSINWRAEPRMTGYDTQSDANETYDPDKPFRDWFPAFLVERGAPAQSASWAESAARKESKAKPRKDNLDRVAPTKRLDLPSIKKAPGRPRKTTNEPILETMDSQQPVPTKKRGRPPKHPVMNATEVSGLIASREKSHADSPSGKNPVVSAPRKRIKLLQPIRDEAFIGIEDDGKTGGSHQVGLTSSLSLHHRPSNTPSSSFHELEKDDDVVVVSSRPVGKAPDDVVNPRPSGRIEADFTLQNDSSPPSLTKIPKQSQKKTFAPPPVVESESRRRRQERPLNNSAFIT